MVMRVKWLVILIVKSFIEAWIASLDRTFTNLTNTSLVSYIVLYVLLGISGLIRVNNLRWFSHESHWDIILVLVHLLAYLLIILWHTFVELRHTCVTVCPSTLLIETLRGAHISGWLVKVKSLVRQVKGVIIGWSYLVQTMTVLGCFQSKLALLNLIL